MSLISNVHEKLSAFIGKNEKAEKSDKSEKSSSKYES